MSEITLLSRELTFLDMEFQKSDITSKDKLQNIVNEVVEDGEPVSKSSHDGITTVKALVVIANGPTQELTVPLPQSACTYKS